MRSPRLGWAQRPDIHTKIYKNPFLVIGCNGRDIQVKMPACTYACARAHTHKNVINPSCTLPFYFFGIQFNIIPMEGSITRQPFCYDRLFLLNFSVIYCIPGVQVHYSHPKKPGVFRISIYKWGHIYFSGVKENRKPNDSQSGYSLPGYTSRLYCLLNMEDRGK